MKRLVVCCDGTWNRPDQVDRGRVQPSNVAKLALMVTPSTASGIRQQVYYHPGVGTGRWDRIRGGAFGVGLSNNIRDAYLWLAKNFDTGDELFLFGFSRGAYTARSLAGLIRNSGLLRRECLDKFVDAYRLYRRRDPASKPAEFESTLFRKSYSCETRIKCVGVWDTVGALGIPIGPLAALNALFRLRFHDVELSSWVESAFQALAIDEQRRPFGPSIWRQQAHATDQRLEQEWFPGVHVNVGGGYADSGLSDITLAWMADRASSCGLEFRATVPGISIRPDVTGELRDSMTFLYRLLGRRVRPASGDGQPPTYESIAPATWERMNLVTDYQPGNVPRRRQSVR